METTMRFFVLAAFAAAAFIATMFVDTPEANAVVCARGVVRAGCVSARGAAVVRRPVVVTPRRRVIVR
jgi:hypothetical protein